MNIYCTIKDEQLREYLHHLFAFEDDAFCVFRDTDFGKYICSMVRLSDKPVPPPPVTDMTVVFRIPNRAHDLFSKRFIYLDPGDYKRIEDRLKVDFNLDFNLYIYNALQLGLQRKKAIQNFIISRKLVSKIGDIDTLKKRGYRQEVKRLDILTRKLENRADYQSRIIKRTILEFEKTLSI